ncbi:Peptidase S8, subtilisin-related [Trema orientale]|uniref:Peptidase S8, subtilisin-related n=1 Tax=Trema orientale TaxID=63057 RepID=A0A2P5EZV4_TREOI|nr:Peptidase S8, subtilisin-related [Trema orientale]
MDKSNKPAVFNDHLNWYHSSLNSVSDSANMLYTYNHVIHGFATGLSQKEAELLKKQPGVVSAIHQIRYELHTSRRPKFLGLSNMTPFLSGSDKLSDLVIGVLDTGVWPHSLSYQDEGISPIPRSWKGECEAILLIRNWNRNRLSTTTATELTPRPSGRAVSGASFLGYATGTATGMASGARIATYKVCWLNGCFGADVIAAVDKAIEDGVHILSMSLGGGLPDYFEDNIAIATTAHGIPVSVSAANNGPRRRSLSNVAPWMVTHGCGDNRPLGNGKVYKGVSALYNGKPLTNKLVPIFYGNNNNSIDDVFYLPAGTLNPEDVSGKIVVCIRGENSRVEKSLVVKEACGVGMIFTSEEDSYGDELVADAHFVPAGAVSLEKGNDIYHYLKSAANPTATIIQKATKFGFQPSSIVTAFSSRGPNTRTPEILKPDVLAPGVNILAAWTGEAGPHGLGQDKRRVSFNIKSATPLDYGAGHGDPVAALDPGLVYDITVEDYIRFLCASNYTKEQIKTVTKRNFNRNNGKKKYSVGDLNCPSFAVPLKAASDEDGGTNRSTTVTYTRTLTNVGTSLARYRC